MRTPFHRNTYLSAACVALVATILLVWLSLGVGIIGADGDPANRMYVGVVAIGAVGATIARLHPIGMARAGGHGVRSGADWRVRASRGAGASMERPGGDRVVERLFRGAVRGLGMDVCAGGAERTGIE